MFIFIFIFLLITSCSNPMNVAEISPEINAIDYVECEVKCPNLLSKFTQDGAKGWCKIVDTSATFKFYPEQIPITLYSKSFIYNEKYNLYFVISRDTFTVTNDTMWNVDCGMKIDTVSKDSL